MLIMLNLKTERENKLSNKDQNKHNKRVQKWVKYTCNVATMVSICPKILLTLLPLKVPNNDVNFLFVKFLI